MAVTYNFCIAQGTDCTVPFVLSDSAGTVINLTGFTAAMQLRVQFNSNRNSHQLDDGDADGLSFCD
jgi:hypothetical protein